MSVRVDIIGQVDDGEMPNRFDSWNESGCGMARFDVPIRDQLWAHLRPISGGSDPSAFKIIEKAVDAESEDGAADVMVQAIADCLIEAQRWGLDETSSQELKELYSALDGDEPTKEAIIADAEAQVNLRDLAATHDADR